MWNWLTRKKKNNQDEFKVVRDFAKLLREHGETILAEKGRLSLTTQILISLNRQFQKLALTRANGQDHFQVIVNEGLDKDLGFIYDFIQKTPNLKLVSGPVCSPSPQLCLLPFKSLQTLEIHRVPIVYVRGLHLIARHINTLICCRSTSSIKDAVYEFGRDFNGILTLLELETLDLSYNTITTLDQSLKLLPSLRNLNLCHNCLKEADSDYLPPVSYLNLGFNSIGHLPSYSIAVTQSLTVLILRNNNISSLEGLNVYNNLRTLDLSNNCLVSFEDLSPLAHLQRLVSLSLLGNPVAFMPKYRLNTISRLSPVARKEPVHLDGKVLDSLEVLCLGKHVEPAPLRSYIPDKPLGRPSTSLMNLANSMHELSKELPQGQSTPCQAFGKCFTRKDGRKVRERKIIDPPSRPKSISGISMDSKIRTDTIDESIGSRRSSKDDSVIWVHKSNHGEIEVSRSLPDIDYASEGNHITNTFATMSAEEHQQDDENEDNIFSRASMKLSTSSLTSSSRSEATENEDDSENDEDSPTYLVESVISDTKNEREEKESLFVILKSSYLVEKDPFTGQVIKLDLNYLKEVIPSPNGALRVNLRFDLIRTDRRKRLYIFEDIDNIHEFNEFVSRLKPVAAKNRELAKSSIEKWQCLKCSTVFQKEPAETSFNLCPNCKSSMVVEKADLTNEVLENDSSNVAPANGGSLDSSRESLSSQQSSDAKDNANQSSSSVEPLNLLSKKHIKNRSATPLSSRSNTPKNGLPLRMREELSETQVRNELNSSEVTLLYSTGQSEASDKADSTERLREENTQNNARIPTHMDKNSRLNPYTRARLSESPSSMTSSDERESREHSPSSSRCSTPSTIQETRTLRTRVLRSEVSPFLRNSNNYIVIVKDDLLRCDHRLKLYFSMDLFQEDGEDFACILKCMFMKYNRKEIEDGILLVSNCNIYILKIKKAESDVAKDMVQLIAKYSFKDIKFIDYGYFSQSFRIECDRDSGSYKFIVGDTERCEKFLALLLYTLQEGLKNKELFPIVIEDPNPRTLANLRAQIFGIKEDLHALAKRLYDQAAIFTVPPLLKNKKMRIRTHQQCVTGKEFIDWLVSRKEAKSRPEALALVQKLVDVGFVYHVSKELQFQDSEALYKFDVSENNKKSMPAAPKKNGSFERHPSESSTNSTEDSDVNTEICLYLIAFVKIENEESSMIARTICVTKTHLFLVAESHQWPLSRIYQPPSSLQDQYKVIRTHRVIDIIKLTFYEDAPCHMTVEFDNELSDADAKETSWLIMTDTVREKSRLMNCLKTVWEGELAVDLPFDVLPFLDWVLEQ